MTAINPFFPSPRSGLRLLQRPSPQKQIPSSRDVNASQIQRFPTSFMPHLGQVPAASFTTSGCIGQAYCSYRARIAIGVEKSLACGNDSKPVLPVMEAQGRPLQPLDDVNCGVRLAAQPDRSGSVSCHAAAPPARGAGDSACGGPGKTLDGDRANRCPPPLRAGPGRRH